MRRANTAFSPSFFYRLHFTFPPPSRETDQSQTRSHPPFPNFWNCTRMTSSHLSPGEAEEQGGEERPTWNENEIDQDQGKQIIVLVFLPTFKGHVQKGQHRVGRGRNQRGGEKQSISDHGDGCATGWPKGRLWGTKFPVEKRFLCPLTKSLKG